MLLTHTSGSPLRLVVATALAPVQIDPIPIAQHDHRVVVVLPRFLDDEHAHLAGARRGGADTVAPLPNALRDGFPQFHLEREQRVILAVARAALACDRLAFDAVVARDAPLEFLPRRMAHRCRPFTASSYSCRHARAVERQPKARTIHASTRTQGAISKESGQFIACAPPTSRRRGRTPLWLNCAGKSGAT